MTNLKELFDVCWYSLKGLPASRKKLAEEAYLLGYKQAMQDVYSIIKEVKAKRWMKQLKESQSHE